jgi:hypothetical protein
MYDLVKKDKTKVLSFNPIIENFHFIPNFTDYGKKNPALSRPLFDQN